jgi:hypothetical protein
MKFRQLGLLSACVILSLLVVIAFPVVGYFAYVKFSVAGVKSAGIASGVCWLAATAALLVTGFVKQSPSGVAGILVACALRFGLPLTAGIVLQSAGGALAESGFLSWIVVFYLITLAVETTLSVLLHRNHNQGDGKGIVTNG